MFADLRKPRTCGTSGRPNPKPTPESFPNLGNGRLLAEVPLPIEEEHPPVRALRLEGDLEAQRGPRPRRERRLPQVRRGAPEEAHVQEPRLLGDLADGLGS